MHNSQTQTHGSSSKTFRQVRRNREKTKPSSFGFIYVVFNYPEGSNCLSESV